MILLWLLDVFGLAVIPGIAGLLAYDLTRRVYPYLMAAWPEEVETVAVCAGGCVLLICVFVSWWAPNERTCLRDLLAYMLKTLKLLLLAFAVWAVLIWSSSLVPFTGSWWTAQTQMWGTSFLAVWAFYDFMHRTFVNYCYLVAPETQLVRGAYLEDPYAVTGRAEQHAR